jgi:hypothetical protein
MSLNLLQLIEQQSEQIRKDIWDNSSFVSDGVLQCLSQMRAQFEVQNVLQKTAELLRKHANDKSLPNKSANRVKTFIKFAFENTSKTSKTSRENQRKTQFRKLPCNAFTFCGLSYTIREVLELPPAQFDFLIANVEGFINRQNLLDLLYREDITKAINSDFDPDNDNLFKEFLKCRFASGGIAEN